MVKQGPVPAFVHTLYEYLGGIALIAAPLLVDYPDSATAASIVLGVLVIFLAATTSSTMSLVNQVPLSVHILLDYALAAVLIASPFIFSFSGKSTPTAIFIAAGVLHLLVSIGTRYRKDEAATGGRRKHRDRTPETGEGPAAEPVGPGRRGGAAAADPAPPAGGSEIPEYRPPGRDG